MHALQPATIKAVMYLSPSRNASVQSFHPERPLHFKDETYL
jgi:hypothetical protein